MNPSHRSQTHGNAVRKGFAATLAAIMLAAAGAYVLIAAPPSGPGTNRVSASAPAQVTVWH